MPALAPELRPFWESAGAVGEADIPVADVPFPAPDDAGLKDDGDELDVGLGMPVVGKVRGVDVSEEDGVDVVVALAGTSEAWKLSWYSGAKRT